MFKKCIQALFAVVAAGLLCVVPTGCSGGGSGDDYVSYSKEVEEVSREKFLSGEAEIMISVPDFGLVDIICKEGDGQRSGTGRLTFITTGMRMVYDVEFYMTEGDTGGSNLEITFLNFVPGESQYNFDGEMTEVKQYLHVENPDALGNAGQYSNAIVATIQLWQGYSTRVSCTAAETARFYGDVDNLTSTYNGDFTAYDWCSACLTGTYTCFEATGDDDAEQDTPAATE